MASKIMVYMVKGVSNGQKEVVATYASANLSATQMYSWTWKVIGALERSGIAVAAFVCDGSSTNRAFIKKHKPCNDTHPNENGVVYCTLNKCARERKLFFISDVPHLLKTIRNCFLNSRWDKLKSRRKMLKNGKRITWDFIIKLYNLKQGKTLRKSYKLNAMNVYPDSYARMKVKFAAEVLSKTVCKDLRSQGWADASETATFIELVNDWFDCLNGAHSSIGKRVRNENLAPYTLTNKEERFQILDNFLKYLEDWENDAANPNSTSASVIDLSTTTALHDGDISEIECESYPENDTPIGRRQLSKQTKEGIRMTTLAFKPLVNFLLQEGVKFINARIFNQDPLEQHFSKIRAGQGGSNNPNLLQALNKIRALHVFGHLGMRKRKGNSGEDGCVVEVTTEPLAKRKCVRGAKFVEKK
ncbi:Transposable element P transposase [Frankliniella fusca]|uniref:Transposable element P transposase n=1 Tax=Frankliniella fusca TaxID=407009 RepID=A0AAE1HED5_9NEOP|nr:Transposable element P transposase [Frankliniella fusca]